MREGIREELGQALSKIDRPGSFCVSGSAPAVLPGLEVEGLGPIGLPLTAKQAKELKKHCHQAPYGKGEKTLVDTSVRRVWRMEPDRFSLTNPDWERFIEETVAKVQEELGLEKQKLESHLYDLLLYEPGSFFLPHRDGEKLDRMVATLVVVLPSSYRGGRARRPARRAGADDRFRRRRRQPVPHPLRRVLRRLRARGPPAPEGLSPVPGLQPDAREVEEAHHRAARVGTHREDQPAPPRMGGGRLGREAGRSRWTISTPRTGSPGMRSRAWIAPRRGPPGGRAPGGLPGLPGAADVPGIGLGGVRRRRIRRYGRGVAGRRYDERGRTTPASTRWEKSSSPA